MLLKSLKVKNFRQFVGEQQIEFATDSNKNVTIIMGENGSGKTSLAQAFTWCLYANTDFADKMLLCKVTSQKMLPGEDASVRVAITLIHNDTEYVVIREQRYFKDNKGILKSNNTVFKMAYKNVDGQQEFVRNLETEIRMKEILPEELSRYFFFDGERIDNMGKEIRGGKKSTEFADAVKNLLGLSAFNAALDHLNGRYKKNTVIRSYESSYDEHSDNKMSRYTKEIDEYREKIENIDKRLEEIESQLAQTKDVRDDLNDRIRKNADSEKMARERDRLLAKRKSLTTEKADKISLLLRSFNNNAPSFFSKKLMKDAVESLSKADKLDRGIPDIHARTIKYLIERKVCLCGHPIEFGSEEYNELNKLLEYIPPQAIGNLISQFVRDCEVREKNNETFFEEFSDKFKFIREFDENYFKIEEDIRLIEQNLTGMEKIGNLKAKLTRYEKEARSLKSENDSLNIKKGGYETSMKRTETLRNELALNDSNNKKIETYKAYAQYMYDVLQEQYTAEEARIRMKLESTVNEIFKNIYNGGFSLSIDEKYNIQIMVDNYEGYTEDIETSTAQSISVIFAFIAGVIKMARESRNPENEMLISEPYPLVMDAPLSAFDKRRIKTVCEVLPGVAEQVIIFIKDTDGELAEKYMSDKVGKRYNFEKHSEFETYLI